MDVTSREKKYPSMLDEKGRWKNGRREWVVITAGPKRDVCICLAVNVPQYDRPIIWGGADSLEEVVKCAQAFRNRLSRWKSLQKKA